MTTSQPAGLSPYDKYLTESYEVFQNVPVSSVLRNTIQIWYSDKDSTRPTVMISRRSYLLNDGNVTFQDVITMHGLREIVLNAEFTPDKKLINSTPWTEDPIFESIMTQITKLRETAGSEMSVRINYTKAIKYTSQDGSWVKVGSTIEGQRSSSKEKR